MCSMAVFFRMCARALHELADELRRYAAQCRLCVDEIFTPYVISQDLHRRKNRPQCVDDSLDLN